MLGCCGGKGEGHNLALKKEVFLLYSKATRVQIQRTSGHFSLQHPGCTQPPVSKWAPQLCSVATPQPSQSVTKPCQNLPNTLPHCVQPPLRHTGLDGKQGVPLMKLQHIKNYYSFVFSGFRQCNVIYSKKC